tara:strand:- start:553 stop:717 length:165 start_codon:yes stop_codon:yes gene_type:complete
MSMTPEMKNKLKLHSKHHTAKHMAVMNAMIRSGKSFNQAHRAALKIERKGKQTT